MPPADPYASLVSQEPVRPVGGKTTSGRAKKPFLETRGGTVSLAVLVTIVLIGGIVYLGQSPPPPPPIVHLPKPATFESQMSYRWDAALGRTLKLGLKESVLPTVKLTGGKIKKQPNNR